MTMDRFASGASYSPARRWLHWGMAAFFIAVLCAVEIKDDLPKGHLRHLAMLIHTQLGISILLLAIPRIALRIRAARKGGARAEVAGQAWPERAATIAHGLFYVVMVAMPVLGILAIQTREHDVRFLGMLLPNYFDDDAWLPYALPIKTAHEFIGDAVIGLIAIHWGAVFWHQFIRRDDILARMRVGN